MSVYEFSWEPHYPVGSISTEPDLGETILRRNILWFVSLRWLVIVTLFLIQLLSLYAAGILYRLGLQISGHWPFAIALILLAENLLVMLYCSWMTVKYHNPVANLWFQIVVDLVCLTVVVHHLGSLTTPAPFLFLLHIALSCVFFSQRSSFFVAFLSSVLFNACVVLEYTGMFAPGSILHARLADSLFINKYNILFLAASTTMLFFMTWYVVSKLSNIIRIHEKQLLAAETQTREAQREKEKYIVYMTHQLKSPLDSLRSNITLIEGGYYGSISDEISPVLQEMDKKAQSMGELILDTLKLNTIKTEASANSAFVEVDLKDVLIKCIEDLQSTTMRKNITLKTDLVSVTTKCLPLQIQMLFNNLLSNAINYSHPSGVVSVSLSVQSSGPVVQISDEGIGIDTEKIPHIFDEFFRTKEAVKHNRQSTGIGLAIVKQVAQKHHIKVAIESSHGQGTTFTLTFPNY